METDWTHTSQTRTIKQVSTLVDHYDAADETIVDPEYHACITLLTAETTMTVAATAWTKLAIAIVDPVHHTDVALASCRYEVVDRSR